MPIKKSYQEISVPFTKMSYTPDVPSQALTANEYNLGENVETDVRGIRSVCGDTEILSSVPGTPTYITGGFRQNNRFYFIVATDEGEWYMNTDGLAWTKITPSAATGYTKVGYSQSINITEAWNGTVPIFNDTVNAPFFLPDLATTTLVMYKDLVPHTIADIAYASATTQTLTLDKAYTSAPYAAGEQIVISGVNANYDGVFTVVTSTTTTITYTASPTGAYPGGGSVAAKYTWNYNPNWQRVRAGFLRIYSTPNVGNILVAGDLTATDLVGVETEYPVTVRWSQNFGLNDVPLTWEPTILNVANEFEVPLRGRVLDAWPSNGNLYLCSYWDTVVLTPLNYTTTNAPILGVRLYNQGRGLLTSNCWANTDNTVYGIDARDVWVFDGQRFQGIGNQRVKNWFFDQIDPRYYDRVYMETNTEKNQIEIYYPDHNAPAGGVPNKMLAYRYDLDCWNAPRDVNKATFACESPVWTYNTTLDQWEYNNASRTIVYARAVTDSGRPVQKDHGYTFIEGLEINSYFRRDNIKLLQDYSSKLLVHRVLPEIVNLKDDNITIDPTVNTDLIGNVKITVEGANSVGQPAQFQESLALSTDTEEPWVQINQNAHRVNSIEIQNDPTTPGTIWMTTAATWQYTEIEDDR